MEYLKVIKLKDGRECILRNGTENDGKAVRDVFILTHEQTDYLLSYPDESTMTAEQEAQYLKAKTESAKEIEILAEVEGVVVGLAGIEAIGDKDKIRHRADFGIGVHRVLVVGGAAIALKYRDERSTVDIDMCFKEQNNLYQCCQKVALRYKLPEDWINADVMHSDSFSYALFNNADFYKKYGNSLIVYVASDLDLYCMKLVSFRPKDVEANFVRLYGSEYLLRNDSRKIRLAETQLQQ